MLELWGDRRHEQIRLFGEQVLPHFRWVNGAFDPTSRSGTRGGPSEGRRDSARGVDGAVVRRRLGDRPLPGPRREVRGSPDRGAGAERFDEVADARRSRDLRHHGGLTRRRRWARDRLADTHQTWARDGRCGASTSSASRPTAARGSAGRDRAIRCVRRVIVLAASALARPPESCCSSRPSDAQLENETGAASRGRLAVARPRRAPAALAIVDAALDR